MAIFARWRPGWSAALTAVLAGLALAAAFPPLDLWPLSLVGVAPFIMLARRLSPRRALIAGWLGGLALFTGLMYWILVVMTIYGGLNWVLAGLVLFLFAWYLGSYLGIFCWLVSLGSRGGISPLLIAPLAWAGLEWVRSFAFTGVPWLPLAMGLDGSLPLMQSAELWSTSGLSLLLVLVNALVAEAVRTPYRAAPWWRRGAALVLGVALVAGGWWWGAGRLEQVEAAAKDAPNMAVSVVQGDVSLPMLWQKALRPVVVERHVKATRREAAKVPQRPWLVVWPESAAPFYFMRDARPSLPVLNLARELDAYIMLGSLGAVEREGRLKVTNRSWMVGPDGTAAGFYDKVHLVPFGEYVPWSQLLFFVRAVAQIGVDFAVGQQGKALHAGSVAVGPLICYESIFPELARDMRRAGARLLVNQTNDAWFGRTSAPYQHMAHLRFRAVENRLACARAANTGISGFVMPSGRVVQATGLFKPAVASARLPLMNQDTFYLRHGEIVGPTALGAVLLLLLWALWRTEKREA
ncbi:MAG: apolipoprotein N-acyltransferase [Proteobacteria bacterium]|nr:apolipoprotein N-acyltransferase [Pseudomonadota bacterium]MBU1452850.1 apolipoprotein N-acyltransferase [Pseudomonadota bacterium]MBU2467307.1 apolipoprotein N-acyltransferase [Pseudomonadota bacterium]MBU2516789.1 apolipoprotein N-acyltransferase [Pseudomonadota bacterium]